MDFKPSKKYSQSTKNMHGIELVTPGNLLMMMIGLVVFIVVYRLIVKGKDH